jgi:ribosomal protein S18 acetylase RimI-like enzyme
MRYKERMPDQLEYRLATPDDVGAIVALVESAYRGEASKAGWTTEADLLDGQRTDAEAVAAIVTSPDSRVLLAASPAAAKILGCCQLERRAGTTAYFGMFAVRPGLQGAGVGRQLLSEAERQARDDWQARVMEMTVLAQREDLIAWYVRRGYSQSGEKRPFPYGDPRFGEPRRLDLEFVVLSKALR